MSAPTGAHPGRLPADHAPSVIARRIAARTNLRTGARSRKRGRTIHVRPNVPTRTVGDRFTAAGRAVIRRGGPVAGCTPRACWHKYPHAPQMPAGIAVWDRPAKP